MKPKQKYEKKFKIADSKKLSFSTTPKSWAIFTKISQIGPWVSRINWCQGHPFAQPIWSSACIFSVFCSKLSFCWTVGWPYRLSEMNALRINWSYSTKDQFVKFWRKLLSFCGWLKNSFFLSRPFFLLHSYLN